MNPTPDQIQAMTELIAKLLGYVWLEYIHVDDTFSGCRALLHPRHLKSSRWRKADMSLPIDEGGMDFPNWLGSLDAARDLPLEDDPAEWVVFAVKLARIFWGEEVYPEKWPDACMILRYTSEQWCLAWLLYKGYRWVECHTCRGSGKACKHDKLGFCGNEKHKVPCPACSGQGRKFVKEVTDDDE